MEVLTRETYSKKPELRSMNKLRAFPTNEARAKDLVAAACRISFVVSIMTVSLPTIEPILPS